MHLNVYANLEDKETYFGENVIHIMCILIGLVKPSEVQPEGHPKE